MNWFNILWNRKWSWSDPIQELSNKALQLSIKLIKIELENYHRIIHWENPFLIISKTSSFYFEKMWRDFGNIFPNNINALWSTQNIFRCLQYFLWPSFTKFNILKLSSRKSSSISLKYVKFLQITFSYCENKKKCFCFGKCSKILKTNWINQMRGLIKSNHQSIGSPSWPCFWLVFNPSALMMRIGIRMSFMLSIYLRYWL